MFEIIKAQMASSLPFVAYTGIAVVEVASGRAVCALDQRQEVSNHIGSMHAGALFTLGESASGAAMSGAFATQIMSIRPIATGATIAYSKVAKGRIVATAIVDAPVETLLTALEAEGRTQFDVSVTLANGEGETVATMSVGWLVSKRPAA